MLFAHDTERALSAAAALVNTEQVDADLLPDLDALEDFLRDWKWSGHRRRDRAELDAVRALRPELRRIWTMNEDDAAAAVNALLRRAQALPQLVKLAEHLEWGYYLSAMARTAPLADRMGVEAAMAFVDVIRQKELHRLQICAAQDCGDVLVDLSKNSSRRFCSASCSNRTNVAAYRARRQHLGGCVT